jgi:NAD(P)-dependent dehydrogenase (short-subunit alcohol dehydrogenase family)
MAEVAGTVPLGRFGTPGDLAGLCLFLASPLAAYVSGANLVAHGGGERPAFLAAVDRVAGGSDPVGGDPAG